MKELNKRVQNFYIKEMEQRKFFNRFRSEERASEIEKEFRESLLMIYLRSSKNESVSQELIDMIQDTSY